MTNKESLPKNAKAGKCRILVRKNLTVLKTTSHPMIRYDNKRTLIIYRKLILKIQANVSYRAFKLKIWSYQHGKIIPWFKR